MPKYVIAVGRLAVSGTERVEVGNFLVEAATVSLSDPEVTPLVDDVLHIPISRVPTPVARNLLVKTAKQQGVDILFMVDDDMGPPEGFFRTAFLHLANNPPCVIGCPYVCGGIHQQVQVFEFASPGNHAQTSFKLEHIPREDAARRKGVEKVANIGTGVIAYHMGVFDRVEPPYYDYSYGDAEHTSVTETEDCYCHRRLHFAGVPLYASWDHWATHHKVCTLDKPYVLEEADIERTYLDQAKSLVRHWGP